jgi:hypothetical protein
MQKVQDRFAVQVPELPDTIDTATYSKSPSPSSLSLLHTLLLFPRFASIPTHQFYLFIISLFSVMYGRTVKWKTRRMQEGSLV